MKDHEITKTVNDLTAAAKFFRHTHQLREQMRGILAQVVERVSNNQQDEINALKAQVNCLRHCLEQARNDKDKEAFERCYGRTLASTKEQCLAEVKAKAIEDALLYTEAIGSNGHDYDYDGAELQKYAEKLREQAK